MARRLTWSDLANHPRSLAVCFVVFLLCFIVIGLSLVTYGVTVVNIVGVSIRIGIAGCHNGKQYNVVARWLSVDSS